MGERWRYKLCSRWRYILYGSGPAAGAQLDSSLPSNPLDLLSPLDLKRNSSSRREGGWQA
jgi:hypothetical protein